MFKKNKNKKGFTLIESLVALFIFSISALAFYGAFSAGTSYLLEAKNRSWALSLANEKMEIIRNLNYDDIGTIGGIPNGSLKSDEDVSFGGKTFRVVIDAHYVDDSFDEAGASDKNGVMTDYKVVKVSIFWGKEVDSQRVNLVSRFVPPGVEIGNPDEGTLVVNILSQDGPVSGADVDISNTYVSPVVNLSREADDNGQVYIPGAEQSIQTYKIKISKSGYETVETMDPSSPEINYNPFDKNGSVVAGSVNISNITINKLANLKISSIDSVGNSLANANFSLVGGRQLDVEGNVFNVNELNQSTGSGGGKIFSNISPGNFTLTRGSGISDYTFIGMGELSPFSLNPDESKEIVMKFASDNLVWLMVTVKDTEGNFLEGASVKLSNTLGYDKTLETAKDGVVFFPDSGELLAGEYNLEVALSGFKTKNSTINVAEKTTEEIILEVE